MYDSFAISPSHCAPKSLADRSTYVFLVARPACNVQITLPASPPTILFWFEQAIAFLPIHLFYIYIYIYIYNIHIELDMSEHASFQCFIHLPFLYLSVLPKAQ